MAYSCVAPGPALNSSLLTLPIPGFSNLTVVKGGPSSGSHRCSGMVASSRKPSARRQGRSRG